MTGSIFKSARYFCDVDSGLDFVEFKYTKYIPGKGYELFSDTLRTKPECDWIEINSLKQTIPYENFLNTMVLSFFGLLRDVRGELYLMLVLLH